MKLDSVPGIHHEPGFGAIAMGDPNAWAGRRHATVLAISDTHGSSQLLERTLRRHGKEIDLIVHLGDHVWPLPELVELAGQPMIGVAGNCDKSADLDSPLPDSLRLTVAGYRLFLTHGHRFHLDRGLGELAIVGGEDPVAADLVLFGHTHRYLDETRTASSGRTFRLLNPGSAAESRGGPEPSCALVRFAPERIEISRLLDGMLG